MSSFVSSINNNNIHWTSRYPWRVESTAWCWRWYQMAYDRPRSAWLPRECYESGLSVGTSTDASHTFKNTRNEDNQIRVTGNRFAPSRFLIIHHNTNQVCANTQNMHKCTFTHVILLLLLLLINKTNQAEREEFKNCKLLLSNPHTPETSKKGTWNRPKTVNTRNKKQNKINK